MICKSCAWGADYNDPELHRDCQGCDCMHMEPDDGGNKIDWAAVEKWRQARTM